MKCDVYDRIMSGDVAGVSEKSPCEPDWPGRIVPELGCVRGAVAL